MYRYDIFLSYRRSDTVGLWVKNHLFNRLEARVNELAGAPVRISCDLQIAAGAAWPNDLRSRIRSSSILLSVWSADYFRSDWCMAEWQSFRAREQLLGLRGDDHTNGLVFPVRYADGEFYHPDAANTQCNADFSGLNYPDDVFRLSAKYIEFDQAVQNMCAELVTMLATIPPWRPDFPIVEPAPMAPIVVPRSVL